MRVKISTDDDQTGVEFQNTGRDYWYLVKVKTFHQEHVIPFIGITSPAISEKLDELVALLKLAGKEG